MTATIVRSFRLNEPTKVDTTPNVEAVLATMFQVTETTYSFGVSETEFQVRGRELKANGTVDERKPARWFTLFGPIGEFADLMPDPRKPFIEALHAIAEEKGF